MPGKLSANFRDIRKKLKQKSKMLGVFPPSHPIRELRGNRRLVVLDIDEYKTSRNYSDPTLPPNSPDHPVKHVNDIYAVVANKRKSLFSRNSY
jgi:hypothetical protein